MNEKVHLRSLNQAELIKFLKTLSLPRFRAAQIMDWLHQKHAMDFSEMKNIPKALQEELRKCSDVSVLELVEVVGRRDRDSIKFLMRTRDGHLLESVLIQQSGRHTVCVSTQLGCRIRCTFCASGKGKFGRNLSAGEIVEQISHCARYQVRPGQVHGKETSNLSRNVPGTGNITNVVFMGMGEPLDNYEATMKAIEILTADWGFALGGRRITVSTSGITPMIEKFVSDSRGRASRSSGGRPLGHLAPTGRVGVRLSVSLHSSDQETRQRLVPIAKKYKLDELIRMLEKIHKTLKREITFEYTLIRGINDSQAEARGVARIASRLGAKVNLIPYNPIREMDYETPDPQQVETFCKLLEAKHVRVTVRQTAGRDIDAACGQLRLDRTR